jgi:hypothetical protein
MWTAVHGLEAPPENIAMLDAERWLGDVAILSCCLVSVAVRRRRLATKTFKESDTTAVAQSI